MSVIHVNVAYICKVLVIANDDVDGKDKNVVRKQ